MIHEKETGFQMRLLFLHHNKAANAYGNRNFEQQTLNLQGVTVMQYSLTYIVASYTHSGKNMWQKIILEN